MTHRNRVLLIVLWLVGIGGINLWSSEPVPGDEVGYYGDGIHAVAADGNYGIFNEGTKVRVMDISNPAQPIMKGTVEIGTTSRCMILMGKNAYVTGRRGWIFIIDISDADKPQILSRLEMTSWSDVIWVRPEQDYAYVGEGGALSVVNIQDKSAPFQLGRYTENINDRVFTVIGKDNFLYIISGTNITGGYFSVWDISNPSIPSPEGFFHTPDIHSFGNYNSIDIFDNTAYWSNNRGLQLVDVTQKDAPAVGSLIMSVSSWSCPTVSGSKLYLSSWGRLDVFDISQPSNPILEGELTSFPESQAMQSAIVPGSIFTARVDYLSVTSIDSSPPEHLLYYSETPIGWTASVAVRDDILYSAGHAFFTLDISTPSSPTLLHYNQNANYTRDIKLWGDRAFAASGAGIEIWDITDPSSFSKMAGISFQGGLLGRLDIEYPLLSACNRNTSASLFRIESDGLLSQLSQIGIPDEHIYATALKSPSLYLLANSGVLYCYDISDTSSPTLARSMNVDTSSDTYWGNHDMEVVGDNLHIFLSQRGYYLFQVHDPLNPVRIIQEPIDILGGATGISVDRNKVYLAFGGWKGGGRGDAVAAIDISIPTSPQLLGTFSTPDYVNGIAVQDEYIYTSCEAGMIRVNKGWPTLDSPPSSPTGKMVLTYYLTLPSVDPEGATVMYTYHWRSDGGDEVVHGPKSDQFDIMSDWELVETGETWTVTVTPNDGNLDGPVAVGKVKIVNQETGAASWMIY